MGIRHAWLAAVVGATGAMGAFTGAAKAQDLVVGAFGGVWETSLRECVVAPFEKKTGKKVAITLGAPVQWLNQIAANPSKPPLDAVYLPTDTAFDAIDRGLVEKFGPEKVPNVKELGSRFVEIGEGHGVINNYGAMGVIYNKQTITEPPKSWKEFVEGVAAGKWRTSIPSINYAAGGAATTVWMFTHFSGGTVDDITPGLATIKRMMASGKLSFWTDPNQVLNQLKGGDIDMAMYWDGRAWAFIDGGNSEFNYYNPEPGAVAAMTWIQKVKGGSDLAWEFINTTLDAKVQSCFGSRLRYGTSNPNAVFDENVRHQVTKISELIFPPFREIPPRLAKWVERWNKEIGR